MNIIARIICTLMMCIRFEGACGAEIAQLDKALVELNRAIDEKRFGDLSAFLQTELDQTLRSLPPDSIEKGVISSRAKIKESLV
jgi:hypothetical protein